MPHGNIFEEIFDHSCSNRLLIEFDLLEKGSMFLANLTGFAGTVRAR